jgi:hypothetical protein
MFGVVVDCMISSVGNEFGQQLQGMGDNGGQMHKGKDSLSRHDSAHVIMVVAGLADKWEQGEQFLFSELLIGGSLD